MINSVLDYLDCSANKYAEKIAYADSEEAYSFGMLQKYARSVGTCLSDSDILEKPVAVFLDKSVRQIAAFMGVLYGGGFYCPIDVEMPSERVAKILKALCPRAIITDEIHESLIKPMADCDILIYEEMIQSEIDEERLAQIRERTNSSSPAYVLFTSGSTGEPKGVVINHEAIIDFTEWMCMKFDITEDDVFGNQSPLHFDLSIGDLYCTLKSGCTNYLIPKQCFSFPAELIKFLNDKKVTIIFWVPSALVLVAKMRILSKVIPQYLTRVLFCGEVMPNKQLNIWRKALPGVIFANLYGPCEACDASTYYIVDRDFEDDESLPIGFPCENTKIIVLNEENKQVGTDEEGELCIGGVGVALGYYNDSERTEKSFVQNPLNNRYREIIYRTGDIVKYNQFGELIYLSRKDFQIKHMGHRIELGEIEVAAGSIQGCDESACIYDDIRQKIVLFFTGKAKEDEIRNHLAQKVNDYMVPSIVIGLKSFPHNANGKLDRKRLKEMYMSEELK